MNLKISHNQYRNIKGVHYKHHTSDPAEFEACKKLARMTGLKYRIIDDQFYVETARPDDQSKTSY